MGNRLPQGTISPVATLLDVPSGAVADEEEHLRQASINAGIAAGVLKPEQELVPDGRLKLDGIQAVDSACWIGGSVLDTLTGDSVIGSCLSADHSSLQQISACHCSLSSCSIDSLFDLSECEPNTPRFADDMYTPRWIRGIGKGKEGMCPVCFETGVVNWKRMKCSAYWYHLNYYHGISSLTGRPFPAPEAIRYAQDTAERKRQQGFCKVCKCWVNIDSSRKVQINVPQIYWWKHIQACLKRSWDK